MKLQEIKPTTVIAENNNEFNISAANVQLILQEQAQGAWKQTSLDQLFNLIDSMEGTPNG